MFVWENPKAAYTILEILYVFDHNSRTTSLHGNSVDEHSQEYFVATDIFPFIELFLNSRKRTVAWAIVLDWNQYRFLSGCCRLDQQMIPVTLRESDGGGNLF